VSLGATQQFSSNTSGVTWALTGANVIGSIDKNSGLYTAPNTATTPVSFTVTATAPDAKTGAATLNINAVGVTVSPGTPPALFPNNTADSWPAQTAQFTATVNKSSDQVVHWAVVGGAANGTIDANGVYTAPTVAPGLPGSVTITATAQADTTKLASAVETLNPVTIPGMYSNIIVSAADNTATLSNTITLIVQ